MAKIVAKLSLSEAQAELKRLYSEIEKHNIAYHEEDNPLIEDWRYDALFRRMLLIERRFAKLKKSDSPSIKVGGKIKEGFLPYEHKQRLLSLENAMDEAEALEFTKRVNRFLKTKEITYFAEPKIDGVSVNLCYKNGILACGASRGDGIVGEDVTANLVHTKGIPHSIANAPKLMEIKGEVYMQFNDFDSLNEANKQNGLPLFSNPRNAAAGSLRQQDASIAAERKLRFLPYRLDVITGKAPQTQEEALSLLKEWGFEMQPLIDLCKDFHQWGQFYRKVESARTTLPYAIDGVVYKINQMTLQQRAGSVSRHPRWAIAWKFKGVEARTIVKSITVQVGRRGSLTPVAELEKVSVADVIVKRATLHNQDEIKRLNIGIGDEVLIKRAGDVIPKIIKVIKRNSSKSFEFPTHCPSCGTKVERKQGEAVIFCPNHLECRSQIIARLMHSVSRNAFDIEGLGEEHLKKLVDEKLIKTPVDLFKLNRHSKILQKWTRWGEKTVANLLRELNDKKTITFARLLVAIGPSQVGERTAQILADNYPNFDALKKAATTHTENSQFEICNLEGIGIKTATDIKNWIEESTQLIENATATFTILEPARKQGILTDEVIVFTGTLSKMARSEAKSTAESLGARVAGGISSSTTMLVAGETSGKKLDMAKAKGIKIINETQWFGLINKAF